MELNQTWYGSNQVVAWFLMFPIAGQILLFAALTGRAEEDGARLVSLITTLSLSVWLGMNARSAANQRRRLSQLQGVIKRLRLAEVSPY